ncbi:lactosylceramide 1,3-N-acetyl-beta-D-glucosaminyltransferase [Ambystoma mexicanum]|uniref:lactosylceramide 1,3-N-acetyl-beta-D-glucosaminyltransferase n=1 Tax=Ambystoma mexicanum TaxID=8296 RepID=UPI0037E8955B
MKFNLRMLIGARRLRRWQFVQVFAMCFIICFMIFLGHDENTVVGHVKSLSYRYLINNYSFVNEILTVIPNTAHSDPNYKYLINHKKKCEEQDVLLLLFVKTSPENLLRRDLIRKTWGNEDYIRLRYSANIKILFALGVQEDLQQRLPMQKRLLMENQKHNDLIQQDFLDTFHNLTLKLLLQFSWVNTYCPHAKFIMSADDDIFVHTPNLVSYLQSLADLDVQDFWIGKVHRGSPPVRNKDSKYYVSYDMYPWPSYPDYTAGAAYVISRDVADKVYKASQTLNVSLYIDDVFMGLCANKIGVVPQHHSFFSGEGKAPLHPCIYNRMMTSHGHTEDLHQLWDQATDPKVKTLVSGFWGHLYCRLVNIMILCKMQYAETYPCLAAWS